MSPPQIRGTRGVTNTVYGRICAFSGKKELQTGQRIIRLIGGLVLFAIVIVIFAAALVFLIKTLSHIFSAASKTAYTISRPRV
jgi:hypothetical protein